MDYLKLLNHSYELTKLYRNDDSMSKLEYLSTDIFDFITYDRAIDKLFAKKALEICQCIKNRRTFEYQENADNYQWYLIMCNMPFFSSKIEWGTSIRGAWWVHDEITINTCGLFNENDDQILELKFDSKEWDNFLTALINFAN